MFHRLVIGGACSMTSRCRAPCARSFDCSSTARRPRGWASQRGRVLQPSQVGLCAPWVILMLRISDSEAA